jgi:hypothetical protein
MVLFDGERQALDSLNKLAVSSGVRGLTGFHISPDIKRTRSSIFTAETSPDQAKRPPIDELKPSRFPADKDVLGHRHIGHQIKFLIDCHGAGALTFGRVLMG